MKTVFNWWYIPIVFFGGLFVLYTGLVGYRLVTADTSATNVSEDGDDGGFWSNLGDSIGLNSRRLKGERDGHVNMLVVGVAGGNNIAPDLTDTIMFVSVDIENNEIDMFSIPRDLYVEVPGFGYSKVNAAYSLGKNYQAAGGGIDVLADTVSDIVGQDIDYYVKIDFDGFTKAVDLLGGVDVDVTEDLYDYLYPDGYEGYQVFAVDAGWQHMDGDTALKYARSRQTTSDFDRARRQQQVIMAMKDSFLSKGMIEGAKVLVQLIDVVSEHLETDLSFWEWERIASIARDWGDDVSVNSFVFDNTFEGMLMDSSTDGLYILVPRAGDFDEIHEYVDDQMNTTGKKESEIIGFEVFNATNRIGLAGSFAEVIEEDDHTVVEIGNSEDNLEESEVYCSSDKIKAAKKYLSKWNIDNISEDDSLNEGVDCKILIGSNFELE